MQKSGERDLEDRLERERCSEFLGLGSTFRKVAHGNRFRNYGWLPISVSP